MQEHDTPEKSYDLERLIFFSDGVFAIVITLLVIELHPPPHWDRTLSGLLGLQWRGLVAYAATFAAVGAYWNVHRQLFRRIVRFHPGLVLLNLLLLALVVLMPFGAELIFESGPRGQPFAIYLGLIAAIAFAQALLWGFAAFVFGVVEHGMARRPRIALLLVMLATAALIGAGSAVTAAGGSGALVWFLPVLILAGVARRRFMAGHPIAR